MFGYIDTQLENRVFINHLLLIFKVNVYKSRDLKNIKFLRLQSDIIEETLCLNAIPKQRKCFKKGETNKSISCKSSIYVWRLYKSVIKTK